MRNLLFTILNCVVNDVELSTERVEQLTEEQWYELYALAKQQGVTALVFEKIKMLPKEVAPPKALAVRWMSHSMNIAKNTKEKMAKSASWASLMAQHGVQTLVLKGGAFSAYYPNPYHREFGDLDCCLFKIEEGILSWDGCYDEGNKIAVNSGFRANVDFYKHSHIDFNGLEIENHQFALPIKDGSEMRALELELRRLIRSSEKLRRMGSTHLYRPSADFNALFLVAHSVGHFLYESIRLRSVLDWAFFLKKEHASVEWGNFWAWCDRMNYSKFVMCMNYICEHQLSMKLPASVKRNDEMGAYLPMRILDDMFKDDALYTKGYGGLMFRIHLVGRYFKNLWKFHEVYERNAFYLLLRRMKNYWVKDVRL